MEFLDGETLAERLQKGAMPLQELLKKLLQRCLDKDPKRRLRDIGEARIEIEQAIGGTAEPDPAANIATATSSRRELAACAAVGVLALVAGGLGAGAWLTPNSPSAPAVVSQILPPPTETFLLADTERVRQ